jgi:hypothetical protein
VENHESNTSYHLEGRPQNMMQKEIKGVFGFGFNLLSTVSAFRPPQATKTNERQLSLK